MIWGILFGNQPPHPPTFGRDLPKKTYFFYTFPYQGCTKDAKAKSQLRNHGTSHVMRQNIVASIERLKNTKRKNVMKLVFLWVGSILPTKMQLHWPGTLGCRPPFGSPFSVLLGNCVPVPASQDPSIPLPNPLNCTWWFSFTVFDFDQMSHLKNNFCYKTRQRRIFPKLPSQGLYMNKQCNNIFLVLVWKTTSVSFVTTFDIRILYQKGKDAI